MGGRIATGCQTSFRSTTVSCVRSAGKHQCTQAFGSDFASRASSHSSPDGKTRFGECRDSRLWPCVLLKKAE